MSNIVQLIDSQTGLKMVRIKPSENRLYDIDVTRYMRASDAVFSIGTVNSTLLSGTGSLTIDSLATDNVTIIQFRAHTGTADTRWKVSILFTTAAGDDLEADIIVMVKEDF